ncbi:chorismate mutase [Falsiroseomonas sp. HW251]|uniref:chorismate mutase n=1 Tax=Falsiroseomonas sp. HW251 TaxID=3390998 RepID=UPI003D3214FB
MTIPEELQGLRQSIDNIDAALVHMLAERFRATRQVGILKASRSLPAVDRSREEGQVARLRQLAAASGLDPDFTEAFIRMVIAEVVRQHERIAAEHARKG